MADTLIQFTDDERLKSELEAARRGGVGVGVVVNSRECARCRAELGRIINRGAFCRWCRHRVCKNCRDYLTNDTSDWLCTVCHKQMELTAASGDWMKPFVRRPSKRRDSRIAAVETVKRSLQRSWTFSDASPSPWAALRNSPEMRAYSSMPRHQDCEFIARTAFTNRLNLTTSDEPSEPTRPSDQSNTTATEVDPAPTEEKVSDCEPSAAVLTDSESNVSSPLVGESAPVDSSVPESPLVDKRLVHDDVLEPLTATVFRRVTLKKRRIDDRDLPPGVTPPRSRRQVITSAGASDSPDLRDRGRPRDRDRDDYRRLVFISSSDSSSREELQSDDGDWDYYEPREGEGTPAPHHHHHLRQAACDGGGGQSVSVPVPVSGGEQSERERERVPVVPVPVPIPVLVPVLLPVPVPVPVPWGQYWSPDLTVRVQHLWSMQQLVTVTLDPGQMSQRLSEDLRLAVLKHLQEEVTGAGGPAAAVGDKPGPAEVTDGVVLTRYKPLAMVGDDECANNNDETECVQSSVEGPKDESTSSCSSDESDEEKDKCFYKLDGVQDQAGESSGSSVEDEDSSGEFSMASSLSSSPGSGKFKRVYVVNDSDSDLGELPDNNEDSAQEDGEVTLLSHTLVDDTDRGQTGEFLAREIEYCDKTVTRVSGGGDFILAEGQAPEPEGSDEECGKLCETRGSNTSDEFSGTESMELEQGQARAGVGPVSAPAPTAESARETGRYTSLVMITQEEVSVSVVTNDTTTLVPEPEPGEGYSLAAFPQDDSEVHVVTGNGTTAVVILEEGLPDDDSWVEDLDRDELVTTTEDSSEDDVSYVDREEELRGYNPRSAIDFTLHTIVEESCEESEVELERNRPTEMEKYFFYGVGDGFCDPRELDTMSETSSIHSEGLESLGGYEDREAEGKDPAELASSRLEKYFLSNLLRRDSDGSVGSDSEGKPSPEQRRKRLVRARGTGRQHSSSQDNLHESEPADEALLETEGSSTETDSNEDLSNSFEKSDGQFDTVKRTKKKKRSVVSAPSLELLETAEDGTGPVGGSHEDQDSDDGNKTPQPEYMGSADLGSSRNKQQSRDSGFMGSCDDLLKDKEAPNGDTAGALEVKIELVPETKSEETVIPQVKVSPPTGLIRKDSFNNWSSDEETNLMMSKMRQFFKTMVASQPKASSPTTGARSKPPQLVHFESELTRLMKTVPGIKDEQVKEIVEYLSSEDTWSDSYDSSDYTSSDLEGGGKKSALQEQISASCRQIISNFEVAEEPAGTGARDTALVYQRLVASFSRLDTAAASSDSSSGQGQQSHNSPPLIAKVMQHIGSRLVALMHEVSSAEGGSPKGRYHRRLQHKPSTTSTTEDEEDSIDDAIGAPYCPLPRSKSHDPLIEESRQEASDNERFSWRGSFESALMASDSRTRLASGGEGSVSASALALAAKRRSAGDLLFKTSSREQLDRVRSCGSIGGSVEDKIWGLRHQQKRRSSVPDSGGSNDGDDDSEEEVESGRSTTLPRGLQSSCGAGTNSLPRLPTAASPAPSPAIYKAHSVHQVGSSKSVVSARYRPPGYPPRRTDARRRAAQTPSPSSLSAAHPGYGPSTSPAVVADDASVCSEPVSGRTVDEDDRLHTARASLGARSDSMASVYSGAGEGRYGSVAVRGEVEFGLQYNYKQGALEIYVKQCRDLAAVDAKRNRSDPYVKVYLLPDKSKSGKRKTRVKKHTLNPIFEETLKFHITLEGLESRTLWLSVWHSDMFGRNDFLGEVTMALENKVFDDPLPKFYTLQERTEPLEELLSSRGELIVGLKFVPPEASGAKKASKGCLQVLVKEAKNLAAVKSNGTSDPFCKSYLLPDKGRSSKQKTPVQRKCCSPAWHHTFSYPGVSLEELSGRSLELTIWDHDRLASNEFLGGVRLNLGTGKQCGKPVDWMDASGKETTLWQRMLERPNLWVESCLSLRPSLDVRNNS